MRLILSGVAAWAALSSVSLLAPGKAVRSWEELQPYRGRNSYLRIEGELRQQMFLAVFDEIQRLYGGTVDGQLHEEMILLCPETADFLYTQFTPTTVRYRQGSRPVLEAKVSQVTAGGRTDREKVLALLRYVRDLYRKPGDRLGSRLQGGTEEDLVGSNPRLCELQSRVMAALCQVSGFPSRRVGHFIGGHAVTEVFLEGKWAYLDVRGIYFVDPDGRLASTWEVWQHPEWIEAQSEEVKRDRISDGESVMADIYRWENTPEKYFHPNEVTAIMNYDISQKDRYSYQGVDSQQLGAASQDVERTRRKLQTWRRLIFSGQR